ncbi:MAG: hypothetical protein HRU09_10030 [Oligoflexales bacterium]|nr:hypothetical protein [Oligoflexales bacterium]
MHKFFFILFISFFAFEPNICLGQSTSIAQKSNKKNVKKTSKKTRKKKKTTKRRKKKPTKKVTKKNTKKTKKKTVKKVPKKDAKKEALLAEKLEKEKEEKEKKEEEEEEEEEPEKEFKANFLVEILPDEPIRRWVAKAIEYKVYQDLSEFAKLEPTTKETVKPPPCEAEECDSDTVIVASIYFNGLLRENSLTYEIQDLDSLQILKTGSIPFNKQIGLPELRVEIFKAMKPITGKSGLIDRLEAKAKIKLAREAREKKIQEIVKKQTEEELKEAAEGELKDWADNKASKVKDKDKKDDKGKDSKKIAEKDKKDKKEKGKDSKAIASKDRKGKDKDGKDKDKDAKDGEEKPTDEELANLPPPEPDWWQIAVDHVQVFAEKNREDLKLFLIYFFAIITFAPIVLFSIYQTVSRGSSQFNRSLFPLLLIAGLITFTMILIQGGQIMADVDLQKIDFEWEKLPELKWVGPIFGGFLFGYLLIICLKTAVPLIHGFEEIEHRMISLVLRAWSWLTFVRMVLMTPIVISFLFLIFLSAIVFEVDRYLFFSLLLPLGGLFAWFWAAYMMENFAVSLDKVCVYGPATKKNPWNKCIRDYLSQYFKRAGLEADPKFLDDIIFLPHKEDDVDTYGGGLSKARVVVSRKILAYALNIPEEAPPKVSDKERVPVEFGDEVSKPDNVIGDEELDQQQGIEAPPASSGAKELDTEQTEMEEPEHDEPADSKHDHDDPDDPEGKKLQTDFMKLEDFQKITSFKKYEVESGEGTSVGFKPPIPTDSGHGEQGNVDEEQNSHSNSQHDAPDSHQESSHSNSQHDAPDSQQNEKTSQPEEFEKTRTVVLKEDELYRVKKEADANFTVQIESSSSDYHDFLFGMLLSEIGHVLKRGSGINTLVLMTARINSKLPKFLSAGLENVFAAYHRNFARFSLILSDSISQIYRGEPHLLQYLYFIESGKEHVLSKNAEKKELSTISQEILEAIEQWIPELSKKKSNISLLQKRLLWLKGYFYSFTKVEKRYNRASKLFKILAPVALVALISYSVVNSFSYNSVYHERIEAQKRALEEKTKEKEAKEQEANSSDLPIQK